ncbi:MAG: protein kinase domain-containing protein [Carbonactinosporaceae bacterium]
MDRSIGSRYVARAVLGRGGFGTVWRGEGPDGAVAIKLLREELATDPDVVARFLRERSVLVRLRHPNLIKVRDLVAEGETLALVMDLVDGHDLRTHLRERGPLPPAEAAELVAAVLEALAVAHDSGVVHRDVKPENVLLGHRDGAGEGAGEGALLPLLTDFGVARLVEGQGLTKSHTIVGTPNYLAPEIASGQGTGPAADVYAAGILLYELVSGHPPFAADHPMAVLRRHLEDRPQRPSGVPDQMWAVIVACLAKDPGARPDAATLARRLRAADAAAASDRATASDRAAPTAANPTWYDPRPPPDPHPRPRGRRTLLTTATLGLAAASLLLGYSLGLGTATPTASNDGGSYTWHVSDASFTAVSNGLGPVGLNTANGGAQPDDGGQLSLAGRVYDRGLGTHAPSHVRVYPAATCSRLNARVGIDDAAVAQQGGSVVFTVLADGTTVYDSGAVTWQTGPTAVDPGVPWPPSRSLGP